MKKAIALLLILTLTVCCAGISVHAQDKYEENNIPLVGDLDGDRVVTIFDATFLQRYLLGLKLPFAYDALTADADEDGDVSIVDVTGIQRWLVGLGYRLNVGDVVVPWPDKADGYAADYFDSGFFIISRICKDHFILTSREYGGIYRINTTSTDRWSLSDEVYITFDNIYVYDEYDGWYRMEGDLLTIDYACNVPDPYICYKPVIYLYPEQETEVDVRLDIDGSFVYTRPAYEDGWQVTAAPDGTLTAKDGRTYPYLFWEAKLNTEYDLSEGFCVSGGETEAFLEASLTKLGLNEKERKDFLDFWLPFMKNNPYNVISFQTTAYTDAAELNISPQPDTTIRVFMTWYASDSAVDIPAQTLNAAQRNGFTAVEWGGQKVR